MAGFFAGSTLAAIKAPQARIPACGACLLYKQCVTPKQTTQGQGRRKILVVSDAPNKEADRKGKHLEGEELKLLVQNLRKNGIDLERDCWLTSSLICRTKKDAYPTEKQIEYCRPNIINTIKELKPNVIILLGLSAIRSVIGWLWKEKPGEEDRWVGFKIPDRDINAWICPTYSLSRILKANDDVMKLYFSRHIEQAVREKEGPWTSVTPIDIEGSVKKLYDDEKTAHVIRRLMKKYADVPSAFDYETNALKPDKDTHKIVSCAICFGGEETIAFPWYGQAIEATKEYLRSPIEKRGANIKFEERWTRSKLNTRVRNWTWDTVLAAHVEDCRRGGICSVKFQSYVKLGFGVYNDHIEEFLQSKGDSSINQIVEEVSIQDLLTYNGIDALVEYLIAEKQIKALKYPLETR